VVGSANLETASYPDPGTVRGVTYFRVDARRLDAIEAPVYEQPVGTDGPGSDAGSTPNT
jgi:hypothetical protein